MLYLLKLADYAISGKVNLSFNPIRLLIRGIHVRLPLLLFPKQSLKVWIQKVRKVKFVPSENHISLLLLRH
jgi:hypothetical protein